MENRIPPIRPTPREERSGGVERIARCATAKIYLGFPSAMSMNRRERVLRAVEMGKPDRCPIVHALLPAALLRHGNALVELLRDYPNDFGSSEHTIPQVQDLGPDYRSGVNRDSWGTSWQSTVDGIHGQVVDTPVHNWEEAEAYNFPPLMTDDQILERRRSVEEAKKDLFVMHGYSPSNYFERLQWILGFKTVLKSLARRTPQFVDFADRLLEYSLESIQQTLEAKPDCVTFADDWGSQDRLLIHPRIWTSFFKPRYKKMFDLVHDHGAYVQLHSDGHITDILDDLYEIGVNILNPQFSCHDLDDLAQRSKGRFCISADIDRQVILPHGSPREVSAYVKHVIKIFGQDNEGGLFGRGELNMDVPLENAKAMFDAFVRYGRYNWK